VLQRALWVFLGIAMIYIIATEADCSGPCDDLSGEERVLCEESQESDIESDPR
jgi:hypothetical protein